MSVGTEHGPVEPNQEERVRAGRKWKFAIGGLIVVFVLLGSYGLISVVGRPAGGTSASGTTSPAVTHATSPTATTSRSASPARPGTPTFHLPLTPAGSPSQHPLAVAAVAAFGPNGTSDGDNSSIASRVIDGSGTQPWYSSWYASPQFGNLQAGTGLLLDMGQSVTLNSVHLVLGSSPGAAVQVGVGDVASLPALSTVAAATDAGGTVQLPVKTRASGRYVLIWFTTLPPDGVGKYQVDVYSATIYGTAGK